MFTVIFAVGRTVGWVAHWNEMIGGTTASVVHGSYTPAI